VGPRVSLDQWLVFCAVVDAGSFARAAETLHRSQSAVSYALNRMQEQLGLRILRPDGRRAVLTEAGQALLPRARRLLDEAEAVERSAREMAAGWEPEVRLTVDRAFPCEPVMAALRAFTEAGPGSRVRLHEAIMSGVDDALVAGRTDLAIGGTVPEGFIGDQLLDLAFIAVAAPDHPLAAAESLTLADLRRQTQVVVSDSGERSPRSDGLVGADQAWHVASLESKRAALLAGLGFGWLPRHMVEDDIRAGRLAELPLTSGRTRHSRFHLIHRRPTETGPAATLLAGLLRKSVADLDQASRADHAS